MNIDIYKYDPGKASEWDNFIEHSENGTIFHTRRFLSYHPTDRFKDHSLIFKIKDKTLALLAANEIIITGKRTLISHSGTSFSGFIYDNVKLVNAINIVKTLTTYARKSGFHKIIITQPPIIYNKRVNNNFDFSLINEGYQYLKRDMTSIIGLNRLVRNKSRYISSSSTRSIRKAEKMDIKVEINEDIDSFYSILSENHSRKNITPTHTLDELITLKNLYKDKITLFSAYLGSKNIAGVLVFECNSETILTFYIASQPEYQLFRPINLLLSTIMEWAESQQFKYIDLGTISINMQLNEGLSRFKESFGALGIFKDTFTLEL